MFWSEQDSKSERIIAQRPRGSRILDGATVSATKVQRKLRTPNGRGSELRVKGAQKCELCRRATERSPQKSFLLDEVPGVEVRGLEPLAFSLRTRRRMAASQHK